MAQFLTTSGISFEIERTLKTADHQLILISPYLKISAILLERLRDADRRNVEVTIVYGKSELDSEQESRLSLISNLRLYYLHNLHAKCYLNESRAVIGSMNMYEFSEKNNREAGLLITQADDWDAFQELSDEADSIINNAELKSSYDDRSANVDRRGYCIRCRCSIWPNQFRPHCDDCYDTWSYWGNEDYPERYCHRCGAECQTSRSAPLCSSCMFKEAKR